MKSLMLKEKKCIPGLRNKKKKREREREKKKKKSTIET